MRYHFCIFSALQQVPFIAMQRSDKLLDLCWYLDCAAKLLPAQTDAAGIADYARELSRTEQTAKAHLARKVEQMKQRALLNRVCLESLM